METTQPSKITTSRIDLLLLNSNPSAPIIATDQQEYYENFYLSHTSEAGITNVHTYKTITYKDIYPHIDMVLHAIARRSLGRGGDGGLKYEFVVNPGGKVSDIKLHWNGLNKMALAENGGISYAFGLGNMKESRPFTYQDAIEIKSGFIKKGNRVGFKIGKYDKAVVLVIDPTLEWATYYGGSKHDGGGPICTDKAGNLYMEGYSQNNAGIATTGVYQSSLNGNSDAFISKFNSSGAMVWTTYYGGDADEGAGAICIDSKNYIYITGLTSSKIGIATNAVSQTSFGGFRDAFVAKFSDSGFLSWGSYFGGPGYDYGSGINVDISGNVFVIGSTNSVIGIATTGAHQTSFGGNSDDVFLAKFSNTGVLIWATYYGGGLQDYGYGVSSDLSGNVYIVGHTYSTNNISTAGTHQVLYSGNSDAFLAKFSNSGQLLWGTYYGGNGPEQGNAVCIDNSGNIYITGYTQSDAGIATAGVHKSLFLAGNTGGFGCDAYLAKFSSKGQLLWGTYYGGDSTNNRTQAAGICCDNYGNIFISGTSGSYTGIATPDAFQKKYGGASLAQFNSSGGLIWSTYFGGNCFCPADNVYSDLFGNIYISGTTECYNGIATAGAFQTSYHDNQDAYIAKFSFTHFDAGVSAIQLPSDSFCPGIQSIKIKIKNYNHIVLDSVNIDWSVNGIIQPSHYWKGKILPDSTDTLSLGIFKFQSGKNIIKAWTSKPNGVADSFPGNDTSILIVPVYNLPNANAGPDTTLCFNQTYTMQGSGGITYLWTPAKYLDNDTIAHPKATLPNTQLYTLYVSNKQGCKDSAMVLLTVRQRPKADFNILNLKPYSTDSSIRFNNLSKNAKSYRWDFGDLKSSALFNPTYQYTDSGNFKITLIAFGEGACPSDTISKFIHLISNGIHIYIPNLFTPSGDNHNDFFEINGSGIKSYSYNIYNRWGENIFQSSDTKPIWDGTFKNQPVMEGVYLYQMDVTDIDGTHHYLSGTVTLVR